MFVLTWNIIGTLPQIQTRFGRRNWYVKEKSELETQMRKDKGTSVILKLNECLLHTNFFETFMFQNFTTVLGL